LDEFKTSVYKFPGPRWNEIEIEMSELSKLLSRKEELNTWCVQCESKVPAMTLIQTHLTEVQEQLIPKAQKLLGKTKEVDPVSGAPRYGVQHCQKIALLNETMGQLKDKLEKLLEMSSAQGGMDIEENETKNKTKSEPAADAIYFGATVFDTALGYKDSQRITEEEKTTMQRQLENERLNMAMDPLAGPKAALKKLLQDVNSVQGGAEEFCSIVSMSASSSPSPSATATAAQVKEGLKFLNPLLQNIVGHPDDEKLRLLRLQHPIVYQKLVCHLPALELLHSAGFAIRCDEKGPADLLPTPKAGEEAEAVYVLGVHPEAGPLPTNGHVSSLFRLAHELNLTVVAFLKEPSVEDISTWVAWFDTLTAVKNACGVQLAKFSK